jgi:hypothetical protein
VTLDERIQALLASAKRSLAASEESGRCIDETIECLIAVCAKNRSPLMVPDTFPGNLLKLRAECPEELRTLRAILVRNRIHQDRQSRH